MSCGCNSDEWGGMCICSCSDGCLCKTCCLVPAVLISAGSSNEAGESGRSDSGFARDGFKRSDPDIETDTGRSPDANP